MNPAPAKILVVEDEGIIAMEIQHELQLAGYAVAGPAFSGAQAIAMAEEARPDAVLMDVVLQGAMDGIETAARLRKVLDVPVVYLTAYGDSTTVARAKTTGPYSYLVKPFRSSELLAAVEVALYRHAMERKLAASEKRFRSVVESAPYATVLIDEAGRVALVNAATERTFGHSRDELLGHGIETLLGGLTAESLGSASRGLLRAPRDVFGIRKDGTKFPIELGIDTIETPDGLRVLASIVDVTEAVRAREEHDREHEQVRVLACKLAETQDLERRELARVLHEGLAQDLFAMQLGLVPLREALSGRADMQQAVEDLETLLANSLRDLKSLANVLRPAALEHLGFVQAIEALAERFSRLSGIVVSVAADATLPQPAEPIAIALYRGVQEALTNVGKHAAASRVVIEIALEGEQLRLTVGDDGRGITPEETRRPGSLGLLGIKERLRELGGSLSIARQQGGGTRLAFNVPLRRAASPPQP
jgi:two-component system sensor histidine kinase UhpB